MNSYVLNVLGDESISECQIAGGGVCGSECKASKSYASAKLPFQEAEVTVPSTEPGDHDFCFVLFQVS